MIVPVVKLAAEGTVDIAVCRRLAREAGMDGGDEFGLRGKDHLDERLVGYNAAAGFEPWIVMRDLDLDSPCAGGLVARLLPNPAPYMRFRVAVRSVEAWLLSDRERFSDQFSVPLTRIPRAPEQLDRPKSVVLELLSNSNSREVRSAMVLIRRGNPLRVGPEYNVRLGDFAETRWRPSVAAGQAASLASTLTRLRELRVAADRLLRGGTSE
jgi:hypothetical protein